MTSATAETKALRDCLDRLSRMNLELTELLVSQERELIRLRKSESNLKQLLNSIERISAPPRPAFFSRTFAFLGRTSAGPEIAGAVKQH